MALVVAVFVVFTLTVVMVMFTLSEKFRGSKLDSVYSRVFTTRCFIKGWGKPDDFKRLFAFWKLVSCRKTCHELVPEDHPVSIEKEKIEADFRVVEGNFISPFVKYLPGLLPKESEIAYFQAILPLKWSSEHYKPVCLHLAGTGDHGYWKRNKMFAKPLIKSAGIGAVLLENPFYGLRKPKEQRGCNLHYVTDLFAMAACLIVESLALLRWCERQGLGPLGLSGISMGGHMASFAAAIWSKPIALIPCLSGSNAAPIFTEGVMCNLINWKLLEKQYLSDEAYSNEVRTMFATDEDAVKVVQTKVSKRGDSLAKRLDHEAFKFMRGIMDECTNLKKFDMPVDPHLVIAVCATDDGYVPSGAYTPWNELWPGAEMRTINAGHVSSYILHQDAFRTAIMECFDRMKKKYWSEDNLQK